MPYDTSIFWNSFFILLSLGIAVFTYFKQSLTLFGAIVAFFLASFLYLSGGILLFTVLMFFFFSSTLIGKIGKSSRTSIQQIHQKSGTRDAIQVFANGGVALIMAMLYVVSGDVRFYIAVIVSFTVATADTWGSEIGVLSKRSPLSILRWQVVQKGISGGVSRLGILASLLGATCVSMVYLLFQLPNFEPKSTILILVIGFMGSILDSVIGDLLQAKYFDESTGTLTERSHNGKTKNRLIQGFSWMTNDAVNGLSIAIATLLFVLIF